MALLITITDAGRAEIINANNTGTGPLVITEIGFGTGQYAPSKAQPALTNEVKRLSSIAGLVVADDTIHVMAKDEGPDAYNVGEFGLYSASGTLVAVYSQVAASGWIIQKAGASTLLLAIDIILESLDAASLTFGDVTFINPPATTETPGVVQLEDNLASTSNSKALTAKQGKKLQDEKQAAHANLAALAGLVGAADKLPYFTGAGALNLATLTAKARTLLASADEATMRTFLGLVIGTNVQAQDATLQALANLTTAADKLIYATGADQFSTATLTAKARTFLASADEATMRAFLGLAFQSTETDPAAGAVLRNGSWGWGDTQPPNIGNLDTYNLSTGVYRFNIGVDTGTTPTGGAWNGVVLHECFSSLIARQTAWEVTGAAADTPKMYVRHLNNLMVGLWREVITSERTTPFSLQLLDDPDAPTMRNSLGLTAAAIAVIVNSATDTGAGRLLTTGYCGLGGVLIATDMDTVSSQPTGFYSTASGTGLIFTPPSGLDVNGIIWNQVRAAAGASAQASQVWVHQSSGRMFRHSAYANAWTAWKEDWNSANLIPAELSPPGAIVHFARNTAPSGWLKANGAAVSRTTYAALFTAIGTTFGAGDGSTTFNLPDARGEFVRGWDDGRGVDSGRAFASAQTDDLKSHSHTQGNYYEVGSGISGSRYEAALGTNDAALLQTGTYGGSETRPRNIALLACIKY